MTYQSLYRRYRPQRFSEIRGQEHVVTALRNAVREGRVGHAYMLSGPRGTGKTTMARILAKALNCPSVVDGEPCGECESCLAIQHGSSFDVHELDAASNNKVEDIRDLISKAVLGTPGRTKVYILDEVHMLTTAASNALLKTLEEPPDHVVFVLATTDPQKVLPTIRSRTQHYDVHLLTADELTELAEFVIADAGLEVPEGTVTYVVTAGAGSARDMESALDQVVAAGGLPDGGELIDELVDALADGDTGRALIAVDHAIQNGRAPRTLGEDLIGRLRDVFLSTMKADLARIPDHEHAKVRVQAEKLGPRGATRALETLGDAFVGIQDAPDPRITLEIAIVRITRPESDVSLAALLERIERLERPEHPAHHLETDGTILQPANQPVDSGAGPRKGKPADHESQVQPLEVDHGSDAGTSGERPAGPGASAGRKTEANKPASNKPASSRPADLARQSLTESRDQRTASSKRSTPKPSSAAKPGKAPPKRPGSAGGTGPVGRSPARSSTARGSSGKGSPSGPSEQDDAPSSAATVAEDPDARSLPTRDELTLAWGDTILANLKSKAKARFGSGRWVGVDSAAVYAVPNAPHRDRCEDCRADVEEALAAHFGRRVPVRLVVEDDQTNPGAAPSDAAPVPDENDIDMSELTDAPDAQVTSVERITDLFPGAELVEGD